MSKGVASGEELQLYDPAFYAEQVNGSVRSAQIIAPQILSIFPDINSAVDIGCGVGTWLSVFKKLGVESVAGYDGGSPNPDALMISADEYHKVDFTKTLPSEVRADLVITLEVAEHLDRLHAGAFVDNICGLSDLILFSAALPGQGGTHHVNERWPSYWIDLFEARNFQVFDVLRAPLWHDSRVEWWYRQNCFLVISKERKDLIERLQNYQKERCAPPPLDCVHPELFRAVKRQNEQLRRDMDSLLGSRSWRLMAKPRAMLRAIKKVTRR